MPPMTAVDPPSLPDPTEISTTESATPGELLSPRPSTDVGPLLDAFLGSVQGKTRLAYAADLRAYQDWPGAAPEGPRGLLQMDPVTAHAHVAGYRDALLAEGRSPSTINRRIGTLRLLVRLARTLGVVGWELAVRNVHTEPYRDTRGPGKEAILRVLAACEEDSRSPSSPVRWAGLRDGALLRLLYVQGLRRFEAAGLDVEHVELDRASLWILAKGKAQRQRLTTPPGVVAALSDWIQVRSEVIPDLGATGPLFLSLARNRGAKRLTDNGIWKILRSRGLEVTGSAIRPHGVRHTAITAVLDRTGGDLRRAQRFSRHAKVDTVVLYDDARRDQAGELSTLLDDMIPRSGDIDQDP